MFLQTNIEVRVTIHPIARLELANWTESIVFFAS